MLIFLWFKYFFPLYWKREGRRGRGKVGEDEGGERRKRVFKVRCELRRQNQ